MQSRLWSFQQLWWLWESYHKEGKAPKTCYFQSVVLEKTPESPLEIKPVNPKRKSTLNTHWKDWCWSWKPNILATWGEELTYWKRPWCWERLRATGEEGNRGWDGGMASPIQCTWTWANSKRWWRTGKPGVLQSMGSRRVRHDLVTEQQLLKTKYINWDIRRPQWLHLQQN